MDNVALVIWSMGFRGFMDFPDVAACFLHYNIFRIPCMGQSVVRSSVFNRCDIIEKELKEVSKNQHF